MASVLRPATEGQLAQELPGIKTVITGHAPHSGATTIQAVRRAKWHSVDNDGMAWVVPFSTSEFPAKLSHDADITQHDQVISSGKLGIVNPKGTILRYVDFAPGFESMMHRTRSLDYGIVIEGSIELILDSGERHLLHRGDSCIQRGTNHAWRNPSEIEWARVVYILQDCAPVEVGGTKLKEYLGRSEGEVPPSGNDD